MKKEIKDLYVKDPKLAIQVAEKLGYTIKIKKDEKITNLTQSALDYSSLPEDIQEFLKSINWTENVVSKITQVRGDIIVYVSSGGLTKSEMQLAIKNPKIKGVGGSRKNGFGIIFKGEF